MTCYLLHRVSDTEAENEATGWDIRRFLSSSTFYFSLSCFFFFFFFGYFSVWHTRWNQSNLTKWNCQMVLIHSPAHHHTSQRSTDAEKHESQGQDHADLWCDEMKLIISVKHYSRRQNKRENEHLCSLQTVLHIRRLVWSAQSDHLFCWRSQVRDCGNKTFKSSSVILHLCLIWEVEMISILPPSWSWSFHPELDLLKLLLAYW